MFKVKDREEQTIHTVYGIRRTVIEGKDFNSFFIYKDNEWVWVNSKRYMPVEE